MVQVAVPVVLGVSGLGQGTGRLGTHKVILQSREGHGCPWVSGTLASGQATPCTSQWSIPAVHMSQVLESVTCFLQCCGHRVPSNSPVQHLDRLRGSVYRFLSVNAKKLSREPS